MAALLQHLRKESPHFGGMGGSNYDIDSSSRQMKLTWDQPITWKEVFWPPKVESLSFVRHLGFEAST
jgi:hypothetical protein